MTTCSQLCSRGHVALTFPSLHGFCRRPGLCSPWNGGLEILRLWWTLFTAQASQVTATDGDSRWHVHLRTGLSALNPCWPPPPGVHGLLQVKSELWQWPLLSPPASLSTTVSCSVMSDSWTVARQAPLSMEFFRQEYIPFFRGSSWPRDQTRVSYTAGGSSTFWATMEARENSGKQISCSLLNFQSRFRTVPLSSQIPGTPPTVPSTQLTVPVLSGIVHASPSV